MQIPYRCRIDAAPPGISGLIRDLYADLNRPDRPQIRHGEYFVAMIENRLVGCSAVKLFADGGYLYGLAVAREWQHRGIGSALTSVRLARIEQSGRPLALVLAMFWNVGFFRRFGFETVRRANLSQDILRLGDLRDSKYRRSAVLVKRWGA